MAEILVNAEQWNALSSDGQNQIIGALRECGTLKFEDKIVPVESVSAEPVGKLELTLIWDPLEIPCKIACDALAYTGMGACLTLGAKPLIAACVLIVRAVQKECRKRC